MRERYSEVEARLVRGRTEAYSGEAYHYGDEPYAIQAEEPGTLADALAGLNLPEGETVGAEPRTTVAAYAIAAGSAVAEMRPAYETGEPLRSRLILDAVRRGTPLGYGIPEEEAVALHAHYLDLRQAGTLDPERDLYEIQTALGRGLHLSEVALYDLAITVPVAEWDAAVARASEPYRYTGGAAYPERVEVREVALAGTAVAP
jgi:hypothetical protein